MVDRVGLFQRNGRSGIAPQGGDLDIIITATVYHNIGSCRIINLVFSLQAELLNRVENLQTETIILNTNNYNGYKVVTYKYWR